MAPGNSLTYYVAGSKIPASGMVGGTLTVTFLNKCTVTGPRNSKSLQYRGTGNTPPGYANAVRVFDSTADGAQWDQGNDGASLPTTGSDNVGLLFGDYMPHNDTNNVWVVSESGGPDYVLVPREFCLMGSPLGTTYTFESQLGTSQQGSAVVHNSLSYAKAMDDNTQGTVDGFFAI